MFDGIFGDMFDFNNDGELDSIEKSMEFMFIDEITKNDNDNNKDNE